MENLICLGTVSRSRADRTRWLQQGIIVCHVGSYAAASFVSQSENNRKELRPDHLRIVISTGFSGIKKFALTLEAITHDLNLTKKETHIFDHIQIWIVFTF